MSVVRLLRVPLPSRCPPAAVLCALSDEPWPFALTGRWAGGGALVGSAPLRVAGAEEDPFALLDELPQVAGGDDVGAVPYEDGAAGGASDGASAGAGAADADADASASSNAVGGGWFGWLGARLAARVEVLAPTPPRPVPLPDFQLAYYDHVLHQDAAGTWWFEALATPEREAALDARLVHLRARLQHATRLPPATVEPPAPFRIAGGAGHVAAVQECRERIAAGEIFQANVCLRLESAWDGDVAALYAQAAERLDPAYGAAFPAPWGGIASLSPELFLRRRGREVETAPIKGTIVRPAGETTVPAALLESVKDHAEHVMIVDLMRNDLGRVSAYGSVVAERTPRAVPHPGLWHLVSRVRGRLRPAVGDGELLRATFPPGSVTGAPKVEALHVIAALEGTGRELYTGAIGYASPLAGLELNVAIRTFEAAERRLWLGAGGGIVADSDAHAELEECRVKARPLLAAIGSRLEEEPAAGGATPARGADSPDTATHARAADAPRPAGRPPAPASVIPHALPRPHRRPDPAQGVFETLLVRDGVALHAEAHLARLAASVERLYDRALPQDLATELAATAALTPGGAGRLRASAGADGTVAVALVPDPRRALPVALAPVTLPGGLGAHKWRDRRLLDALARELGPDQAGAPVTPLLLDGDGSVLEAAWANVFALVGDALLTAPADGRILPGVTRGLLLERAADAGFAPVEAPLAFATLARADAILLTSAAAGAVPARLVPATPLPPTAATEAASAAGDPAAARPEDASPATTTGPGTEPDPAVADRLARLAALVAPPAGDAVRATPLGRADR